MKPRRAQLTKGVLKPQSKSFYKKQAFLSGYEFWGGHIKKAAQYGHVARKSYTNWMESDPEFAAKINALQKLWQEERLRDFRPSPRLQKLLTIKGELFGNDAFV